MQMTKMTHLHHLQSTLDQSVRLVRIMKVLLLYLTNLPQSVIILTYQSIVKFSKSKHLVYSKR